MRERDNLEETDVEGRIMDLQGVGWGGMDWIDQAHDRDRWRALANAAIIFEFHKMWGFLTS